MKTEQVQVYKKVPTQNSSGGFTTTDVVQSKAPTWAAIEQQGGSVEVFSTRDDIQSVYLLTFNYRSDFQWDNDMFIRCRFGDLQVVAITESIRKREWQITGAKVG